MIRRFFLALVIWIGLALACIVLFGPLLLTMHVPPTTTVGNALITWGWVIGALVAIWFFFDGANRISRWRNAP